MLLCPWVTHLCPCPSGLQWLTVNVYRALQRADYCSGWFYPGYLTDPHSGSVAPCHTWETEVGDVEVSGPAVLVGLILSSAFWHHPRAGLVVTVGVRCWPVRPGVPLSILRCLGRSTQVVPPPTSWGRGHPATGQLQRPSRDLHSASGFWVQACPHGRLLRGEQLGPPIHCPPVHPVLSFITRPFTGRTGPNRSVMGVTPTWHGEALSTSTAHSQALVLELNLALKPESNLPFKGESSRGR